MPIPKPSAQQLKNKEGEKEYIASCMSNPDMVSEYDNTAQRYAICIYQYKKSKTKATKGSLALEINRDAVTNAVVKIKMDAFKESDKYEESTELAAAYLEKSGLKNYSKWFLAINPNEDNECAARYIHPITSDFKTVDIAAIERVMEVAASLDDKDLSNQASELLAMALKKKNGESISKFNVFVNERHAVLEASI